MLRPIVTLNRYVATVSLLGTGGAVAAFALWPDRPALTAAVIVLGVVTVLAESLPIKVPRRGFTEEITSSSTFAFALLLLSGLPAALVAQLVASAVSDARQRKSFQRVAFNVGQCALSVLAAGAVLALLSDVPRVHGAPFDRTDMPAILLAAFVLFACNNVLVSVVSALSQQIAVWAHIRLDAPWQAGLALLLLGMSPIVVLVCDFSLVLLPLLVLPMIAVHRAGMAAVRDRHRALHDDLTGLPNRSAFARAAEQALVGADGATGRLAFALLDLNRFKEINDTLGHHQGDELLRLVAERLTALAGPDEHVARLGSDEFALISPLDCEAGDLDRLEARLLGTFTAPFELEGLALGVDASLGLSLWPDHGTDAGELLRRADIALYHAKEAPGDALVYEPASDSSSVDRLALLGDLRRAIDRGELRLAFMPKVALDTGRVIGMEALVRWRHPERGELPPGAFVPHAESTGLIGTLTLEVLGLALAQAAIWQKRGTPVRVAVNLSTRNLLDRRLPDAVAGLLATHGVPPELLELEVTETTVMVDAARAQEVLEELSAMGVHLAIDDFGTGHSSLAYLRRLPVQTLKIDRSFVTSMLDEERDARLVASIVDLGRNIGMRVVAEGVEDEATRDALAAMGCDAAQGFFYGRPAPAIALGTLAAAAV